MTDEQRLKEMEWNPTMGPNTPGLSLEAALGIRDRFMKEYGTHTSQHNSDAIIVLAAAYEKASKELDALRKENERLEDERDEANFNVKKMITDMQIFVNRYGSNMSGVDMERIQQRQNELIEIFIRQKTAGIQKELSALKSAAGKDNRKILEKVIRIIQNPNLTIQLGVAQQITSEGKQYYQGQWDMQRRCVGAVEEELSALLGGEVGK